ncbi:LPXTG cell wall anchor domain-containing protein [Aquihabitans daechungensis]|uniref:LPXTG cell wall anchor domain-containing protein n=1 Tax=Aquihabitans daechungensis TaxID=1052257 RepID=UPI003BA1B9A4
MSLRRTLSLTVVLVLSGLFWAASPAVATENPDYTAPPPTTVITTPTPPPATKVKTAVAVTPVRTRLAITGSDATGTVVLGAGLVAVGAGILVLRRRRAAVL